MKSLDSGNKKRMPTRFDGYTILTLVHTSVKLHCSFFHLCHLFLPFLGGKRHKKGTGFLPFSTFIKKGIKRHKGELFFTFKELF